MSTDLALTPQGNTAMPADSFQSPPQTAAPPASFAAQSAPQSTTTLRNLAAGVGILNGALAPQSMADLITFSELMSRAGPMVGKAFRNNPGACLAITMQAMRWKMDPFAVSQKAYVTSSKKDNGRNDERDPDSEAIAYEAQLVNAVILANAPMIGRPRYEYAGSGVNRRCTVSVLLRGDDEPATYTTPEVAPIGKSPLWKTDLDQQLAYYAIRAWARKHCPDVIMGVYTVDELDDGTAIEGAAREVRATPTASSARASVMADLAIDYDADQRTPDSEADHVVRDIAVETIVGVETITGGGSVGVFAPEGAPSLAAVEPSPCSSDDGPPSRGCDEAASIHGDAGRGERPSSDPDHGAAAARVTTPVIEDAAQSITLASELRTQADARAWFELYRTVVEMTGSQSAFDKARTRAVKAGQIGVLFDLCEETYDAMIQLHADTERRLMRAARAKAAG